MAGPYIALDVETTGLKAGYDAIIEIGACRFAIDELPDGSLKIRDMGAWSSFVNPRRLIPPQVGALTGIVQTDVDRAPLLPALMPALLRFIGASTLVGQSVSFDIGFLNASGANLSNPSIDTFELAGILLPRLPSYSLESIVANLGVSLLPRHRALDDALAARDVLVRLIDRAREMDLDTVRQINRLTRGMRWPYQDIFQTVERQKARAGSGGTIRDLLAAKRGNERDSLMFTLGRADVGAGLAPTPAPVAVDPSAVAQWFASDGPLAQRVAGYEHRPHQAALAAYVGEALNSSTQAMVEAAPGIGRRLAYLVPAAEWAVANNRHVVIAVDSPTLRDRSLESDLAYLTERIPLTTAVLKPRGEYLCLRHWKSLLESPRVSAEEATVAAKVLVWLPSTLLGDRDELFIRDPGELLVWNRLSSSGPSCTQEQCEFNRNGACFVLKAKQSAERAHLVLTDHTLLVTDAVFEQNFLPSHTALVIDDAHQLEEHATQALHMEISWTRLHGLLSYLGGTAPAGATSSFLAELPARLAGGGLGRAKREQVLAGVPDLQQAIQDCEAASARFFGVIGDFLNESGDNRSDRGRRARITSATRAHPAWLSIEDAVATFEAALGRISELGQLLRAALDKLDASRVVDLEGLQHDLGDLLRRLEHLRQQISSIFDLGAPDTVAWAERNDLDNIVSLHAVPLSVTGILRDRVYRDKSSVLVVSPVLTVDQGFGFVRSRLGLEDADEQRFGPAGARDDALLYVPSDMPEPGNPSYQTMVEQAIGDLCSSCNGRVLVLFTSYSQLNRTYSTLHATLAQRGIPLFGQRLDGHGKRLFDAYLAQPRAALFGAANLWDGASPLVGATDVLVIPRLPFPVPTDPVIEARIEDCEEGFNSYAVPSAVLKLRRALAGLTRRSGRSVLVVLDRRIVSKSYGDTFLRSLPRVRERRAPLSNIGPETRAWLER